MGEEKREERRVGSREDDGGRIWEDGDLVGSSDVHAMGRVFRPVDRSARRQPVWQLAAGRTSGRCCDARSGVRSSAHLLALSQLGSNLDLKTSGDLTDGQVEQQRSMIVSQWQSTNP